jgi:hypothetical protein
MTIHDLLPHSEMLPSTPRRWHRFPSSSKPTLSKKNIGVGRRVGGGGGGRLVRSRHYDFQPESNQNSRNPPPWMCFPSNSASSPATPVADHIFPALHHQASMTKLAALMASKIQSPGGRDGRKAAELNVSIVYSFYFSMLQPHFVLPGRKHYQLQCYS